MHTTIAQQLHQLEQEAGIRILYACESGSRAWGFPSVDSDYDVRFIYAHSPDWYFSIEERPDTITVPVTDLLDLGGWDIRKALQHVRKSNPVIFEWLQSPIVYQQQETFSHALQALLPTYFAPRAVLFHHLGLIRKMRDDLNGTEIRLKKVFYVLRSLLSAVWVREKQTLPPMTFDALRIYLDGQPFEDTITKWLRQKADGDEKTRIPQPDWLAAFVQSEWERCESFGQTLPATHADSGALNQLFQVTVYEADDRR